jgi:hypothetical protein
MSNAGLASRVVAGADVDDFEGPIRRPKRGGIEWEPIKILLEGD